MQQDTVLDVLRAHFSSIDFLHTAATNHYKGYLARLILASDDVANRAQEPWEYKKVIDVIEENFVLHSKWNLTSTSPHREGNQKSWHDLAMAEHAIALSDPMAFAFYNEGLFLYVREEDGGFRPACDADPDFAIARNLILDVGLDNLRIHQPQDWARRLYLYRPNLEAHRAIWYEPGNMGPSSYESQKEIKRHAVQYETRRLADKSLAPEIEQQPAKEVQPSTSNLDERLVAALAEIDRLKRLHVPLPNARLMDAVIATQRQFWIDWKEGSPRPKSAEAILPWIKKNFSSLSDADARAVDRVACPVDRNPASKIGGN
ncbi:hypothetical protein [Bordetella genomosp. 4]|uniref:hypothetical protein n=1 Tax=Bordetella genomosp. 4 TaxID=463044 RepID=UPI0011400A4D|nr:hypothetical protein [Bordetella genomosp. 4]